MYQGNQPPGGLEPTRYARCTASTADKATSIRAKNLSTTRAVGKRGHSEATSPQNASISRSNEETFAVPNSASTGSPPAASTSASISKLSCRISSRAPATSPRRVSSVRMWRIAVRAGLEARPRSKCALRTRRAMMFSRMMALHLTAVVHAGRLRRI